MDIIHLLPDAVANQIAAGEVIQRPASVIKELMENALDAGATKIQVIVKNAGRTSIQVIDDGKGMSETDARLSFERHATSKITNAQDLFSLRTMGFRGEALASIAAVASVELRTRQHGADIGTFIEISASTVTTQEPVACPEGTSFLVKNLFFNVPARRKFLKSDDTEMRQIIQEFQRIVLVYPNIHFELLNGDDVVYDLPTSNAKQRISAIFGKKVRNIAQQLVQIEAKTTLGNISGFVGKPEFASKGANQFFFVNGRYMRHPYFHRAVMQAYERMLQPDEMPSYFIYFEVNPSEIDVNIHPTKTEIKFENERDLWSILMISVKEALGKFNISDSIDFDTEGQIDIPVNTNGPVTQPKVDFNPNYNPFKTSGSTGYTKPQVDQWEKLYGHQTATVQPAVETEAPTLFAPEEEAETHADTFMYKDKYILTTVKSGLMFINRQRANERIIFEQIVHQLELQQCATQRTLFPEVLELSADDNILFQSILSDVKALGFDIEPFGKTAYSINGVPALLTDEPNTLEVLQNMIHCAKVHTDNVQMELYEALAFEIAKTSARGQQKSMTTEEMTHLIDQLFACQYPNVTPDGQNIVRIINDSDIDKLF